MSAKKFTFSEVALLKFIFRGNFYLLTLFATYISSNIFYWLLWSYLSYFELDNSEDILLDRVKHEYLFYWPNLVVNSCFVISKPPNYRI